MIKKFSTLKSANLFNNQMSNEFLAWLVIMQKPKFRVLDIERVVSPDKWREVITVTNKCFCSAKKITDVCGLVVRLGLLV